MRIAGKYEFEIGGKDNPGSSGQFKLKLSRSPTGIAHIDPHKIARLAKSHSLDKCLSSLQQIPGILFFNASSPSDFQINQDRQDEQQEQAAEQHPGVRRYTPARPSHASPSFAAKPP